MKRIAVLACSLIVLCAAAAVAASAKWTDPKYGYTVTYPADMHMITKGDDLMRGFMHKPRFALSFTPHDTNEVGNDFLIAEVSGAGRTATSSKEANARIKQAKTQGARVLQTPVPVRIGGQQFYQYAVMDNATTIQNYVGVVRGQVYHFKVEALKPGQTQRQRVLNNVVRGIHF